MIGVFEKRSDLAKFPEVADAGSVSLAAGRLGMTQPALTRIIARLERRFDGKLFERLPTGVRLTALGAIARDMARQVLREIESAEERLDAAHSGRFGIFRITAGPVWISAVLPEVIRQFHQAFPSIELNVDCTTRAEGLRRLAHGGTDLHCGGVDNGERVPDYLRRERFLEVTAGIVANQDHPLLTRRINYSDLAACPWIDFDPSNMPAPEPVQTSLTGLLTQLYQHTNAQTRTIVRNGAGSLLLMASGPYLTRLPLAFLDRIPSLVLAPLPIKFGRIRYHSGFVVRRSAEDLPPFRRFVAILRRSALKGHGRRSPPRARKAHNAPRSQA